MFIPALVITLISLVFLWNARRYCKTQEDITNELAEEADKLIKKMNDTGAAMSKPEDELEMLESPKYLATLCTVLVQKSGGTVRLTEQDFLELPEDEYISVYVDVNDSSILLCLNSLSGHLSTRDDDPVYN